jgi:hypothetical protein
VGVPTLWHASTIGALCGQHITVDHRDTLKSIGQDPGGEQTTHTRAEHHRVFTEPAHH